MRRSALAIAAAVAGLACVKDHPCREDTVMLEIGFADSRDRVDGVALRYSLDDAPMLPLQPIARPVGVDHDRLELEVKSYATYQEMLLQYAPLLAGNPVGAWQDQLVRLRPGCTTATLVVVIGSGDAGLVDTSSATPDVLLPLDEAGADGLRYANDASEGDLRGQPDLRTIAVEVSNGGQDTSDDRPRGTGGTGGTGGAGGSTSTGGVGDNGTGGASAVGGSGGGTTGGSGGSATGGSGGSPTTGGTGGSTVVVDAAMDTIVSPADLPRANSDTSDSVPSDTVDVSSCVASVGMACGSCGGHVACDGSCTVPTPSSYGTPCGSCGGTITCDGTCSVATPSNLGQSCTYSCVCFFGRMPVDGTIGCTGQCEDSASRCGPSCGGQ